MHVEHTRASHENSSFEVYLPSLSRFGGTLDKSLDVESTFELAVVYGLINGFV